MPPISRHVHIKGIVQGVGFRPFIFTLANKYQLKGWVRNSSSGVDIEVSGEANRLDDFINAITASPPPLAQIDLVQTSEIKTVHHHDFKIILSSANQTDFIPISPDTSVCKDCRDELFDPQDRRFHYPFINCTNCGPRFSIIKNIPYDRPETTMAEFAMCGECRQEYVDPSNRRFHAQPIACSKCGPQIWIEDNSEHSQAEREQAIIIARQMLADGMILAVKGLGGFHLACDASNENAVQKLRDRKKRPAKPFAVMAYDLSVIDKYADVTEPIGSLLSSPQAPIVIIPVRHQKNLATNIAPGQENIGFMLPYTPLHLLLLEPGESYPEVLVMTSGNLSEEPVIHENQAAREKLSSIVDGFLMHDRPIHSRIDDSVFTSIEEKPYPIRYARGFAPNPIRLLKNLPEVLAVGPQMKNSFCLTREKYAFLSHYIGEMENWETYQDYIHAINLYEELFRIKPKAIGYDLHPDYLSTRYAQERSTRENLPRYPIQHHHAHLVACMVENEVDPEEQTAGIIFDGTGYGSDGTIWGGEFLLGNCLNYERLFHLQPVPMPGGEIAIQKPARMALGTLAAYNLDENRQIYEHLNLSTAEISSINYQISNNLNTPLTSSMGRLFDTVAALIGLNQAVSYEAQAAIELEAIADTQETGYYSWVLNEQSISIKPMLESILLDIKSNVKPAQISARFHNTIIQLSLDIAKRIQDEYGTTKFAFSGGVWQNKYLIEKILPPFRALGLIPLIHHKIPPNDSCVALGQAVITGYRYQQDKEQKCV